MRMTNKIMQNNSLYNINQNKILQDKLSTQMSTQKKLTRPSDDPVVAIRALRLRSSVSEISQYYEKNAPDAESWLKVTADGLGTVTDILTSLSQNANKGSNKDLKPDDLEIIITEMASLSQEFYSTGNLDYAGRYVFTGYRTNTPMSFTAADVADTEKPIPSYNITEQLKIADFDSVNYTDIDNLAGLDINNYKDPTHSTDETSIKNSDIHRLRLAYDNIDSNAAQVELQVENATGTGFDTIAIDVMDNVDDAYKAIREANESGTDAKVFIPSTGEILFSNSSYDTLSNDIGTETGREIRFNYDKSKWTNGDLRPEHYFACTSTDNLGTTIDFNAEYLTTGKTKQVIEYDVGYNQTIEVNTTVDEVFTHNLQRDIDDLKTALDSLKNIYQVREDLDKAMETATDAEKEDIQKQYDAANKAYTYIRQNIHDMMGKTITKTQSYLDATNVAVTDNGTRSSRLELISNRLMEQKTTFRTLKSENEDADIAEVAVELTSAELTYESSLMATSKIMQTTLMNYI